MQKTIVGVVRGGPSQEYEVSLKTGAAVLEHLQKDVYETRDIFIDRSGVWHVRGRPIKPQQVLNQLDTVFVGLHGAYGEDGGLQRLLEHHRVPFTGSGALASSVAMNKHLAKQRLQQAGIRTPVGRVVTLDEINPDFVLELFRTFPHPCVVKPLASGSSFGVAIARSYNEFIDALEIGLRASDTLLLEEYIDGTEATVGVVDNFRNERLYALPEIEIAPHGGQQFFDYQAKYEGKSDEICPGRFPFEGKTELSRQAKLAHEALNLSHYSRSDFMINKRGQVYYLETNTLPGLTPESLLPKAVEAVGCSFPDFLHHLVTQSLERKTI